MGKRFHQDGISEIAQRIKQKATSLAEWFKRSPNAKKIVMTLLAIAASAGAIYLGKKYVGLKNKNNELINQNNELSSRILELEKGFKNQNTNTENNQQNKTEVDLRNINNTYQLKLKPLIYKYMGDVNFEQYRIIKDRIKAREEKIVNQMAELKKTNIFQIRMLRNAKSRFLQEELLDKLEGISNPLSLKERMNIFKESIHEPNGRIEAIKQRSREYNKLDKELRKLSQDYLEVLKKEQKRKSDLTKAKIEIKEIEDYITKALAVNKARKDSAMYRKKRYSIGDYYDSCIHKQFYRDGLGEIAQKIKQKATSLAEWFKRSPNAKKIVMTLLAIAASAGAIYLGKKYVGLKNKNNELNSIHNELSNRVSELEKQNSKIYNKESETNKTSQSQSNLETIKNIKSINNQFNNLKQDLAEYQSKAEALSADKKALRNNFNLRRILSKKLLEMNRKKREVGNKRIINMLENRMKELSQEYNELKNKVIINKAITEKSKSKVNMVIDDLGEYINIASEYIK